MTVFKQSRGRSYRYDFWFNHQRYTGNTKQVTETDALLVEREIQLRLRHEAGGIAQFFPEETPRFQDWAETFIAKMIERLDRPDHPRWVTGVLLRFWGAKPRDPAKVVPGEPYHDLRLGDPIARPAWILEFEDWMKRRGIGNQSKNHYRGMLRRMYALALKPEYRATTGILMNPFAGLDNDPTFERTVALEPADAQRWLEHASYHIRLAMSIAALAPKLRLAKVLALRWDQFDPDPRETRFNPRIPHYIVLVKHKTVRRTRRPQAMPVSRQLLRILKDAWRRHPDAEYVVIYRGGPVKSIHDGVKAAAEDAGIPYGRALENGATFHTLRHTAATLLALEEEDPLKLKDAMGHGDLRTTLKYRHLRPRHERPAIERLSKHLPIEAIVTAPRVRARRTKPDSCIGKSTGPADPRAQNCSGIRAKCE
ncbi:MAG TPA: tyrosine-type recombinase/integrase [Gemmatimonadales bacterium]|nr:tyrosine-type recombinase/integrase [Gemmatimonadales bacterium]